MFETIVDTGLGVVMDSGVMRLALVVSKEKLLEGRRTPQEYEMN